MQPPQSNNHLFQRNTIHGADALELTIQDEFIGNGGPYSSATAPRQKKM